MKRAFPEILALFALLAPGSFGQTASLKGRVWEPIVKSGIVGADVILTRADKSVTRGISGAGGVYSFDGLKIGERVLVTCRRNKYIPDPSPAEEVVLARAETDKNLPLFENTDDSVYWSTFADGLKTKVQQIAATPEAARGYYEQTWASFGLYGFSAEARAAAARAIMPLILNSTDSTDAKFRRMALYAAADPAELAKAESDIQAVVQGSGHLRSSKPSVAPEIEYEIAFLEARKSSADTQHRLFDELSTDWGLEKTKNPDFALELKNYTPIEESFPKLEMGPKRMVEMK